VAQTLEADAHAGHRRQCRARIPYLPIHADQIERDAGQFSALVLPNLGAMSDAQVASLRQFVAHGGGLLATGESSLFNEWGDPRPDFALADLFGAHAAAPQRAGDEARRRRSASDTAHTYLRLNPERRARVDGPHAGNEPAVTGERHHVLRGFDCHVYRQPGRVLLHLVNLTSAGTWRQPVHELIPVGPLQVQLKLPAQVDGRHARLLVAGKTVAITSTAGWLRIPIKSILDHEVIVIGRH
jgi:hypothetical protein